MSSQASSLAQLSNAQLGAPLPLAYGRHAVQGNELINNGTVASNRLILRLLGEGEWDGIDRLFINAKAVDVTNNALVRFHPGLLGTLGAGLSPTSTGGDQGADQFFTLLPPKFQPLTLSGKAFIFCNVPPDPAAPSADINIIGHYRCLKVRQFDSSGVQTGYAFSTNGAEQVLDLILRRMIKPQWNPALAAAAGGDLTAFEKARIDFPSFADAVAQCNFNISTGKRFESSVAFPGVISLRDALDQMKLISQLFIVEAANKIYIRADQPRASTFVMTRDHVVAGTLRPDKQYLHGATNRWVATFRDLNPQRAADVETPANTGLSRSNGTLTVKTKAVHPFLVGDRVEIVGPNDASFATEGTVATIAANFLSFTMLQAGANATSGNGFVGTPESRFLQRSWPVDHAQQQKSTGQRGLSLTPVIHPVPTTVDLGNNTLERVRRVLNFRKNRILGMDTTPYVAPFALNITAFLDAVDASSRALIAQVQGDVITIDSTVSEEFAGDYEIMQQVYKLPAPDGGQGGLQATTDLALLQVVSGSYSDSTLAPPDPAVSNPRFLGPPQRNDTAITNGDFSLGSANWGAGSAGGNGIAGVSFNVGVSGLPMGASEALVPSTALNVNLESQEYVAVDPTFVWSLQAWIKIGTPLTGGIACYAGLAEYDINHNPIQHQPGGAGAQQLPTQVSLASAFNQAGIWTDGTTFLTTQGIVSGATSIALPSIFGSSQVYNGVTFNFGAANANDVVQATGQTITIPTGKYASLRLIIAVVNGNLLSQTFTVNYSDSTTLNVTQSLVNVTTPPQGFGEKLAVKVGHLNNNNGTAFVIGSFVYEYDFAVDATKQVTGIVLPNNTRINLLAITAVPPDLIAAGLFDGLQSTPGNAWTQFSCEITGNGGSTPGPTQFNNSTAYVRMAMLLNWGSGSGQQIEVTGVKLSPVAAGASRAVKGLTSGGQLVGTFRNNPSNVIAYFTGANPLSQSGTSTTILVSAFTIQYGDGQVSYSAGSVDPGSLGLWHIYTRDPGFNGGVVSYLATQTKSILSSFNDVVFCGSITTSGGGGGTGTGGGGGSCFSGEVKICMADGSRRRFDELPDEIVEIETMLGARRARVCYSDYVGPVCVVPDGGVVTPEHPLYICKHWLKAEAVWPMLFERGIPVEWSGRVYTLEVLTEDDEERHFILGNGTVAHNVSNLV